MSKVFSAKRKKAEFIYEFLDGETKEITANSLSSKEQAEVVGENSESPEELMENYKNIIKKQLKGEDSKTVTKIIKEQYEEGDVIEFSNSLAALIRESKEKK